MQTTVVWDLPTRLFHWLLAAGVFTAFLIAQFAGEHSPLFPYHAMLGIVLGAMVILRIVWGFVGTRYARFASFLFSPLAVVTYIKGVIRGDGERHVGHNPGSSYAIFAMLGLVLLIVVTGLLMSSGNEGAEDVHAIAAYGLIAVVCIHVLGVIVHTVRQHENITLSMISGTKQTDPDHGIRSTAPVAGVLFLLMLLLLAGGLYRNYDANTRATKLPLLGTTIQLGEAEDGKSSTSDQGGDD